MSFADSFLRAYMAFRPSEAELERQRQNEGGKVLAGIGSKLLTDYQNTTSAQGSYDSLHKLDDTFQKAGLPSLVGALQPGTTGAGLSSLLPIALSQSPAGTGNTASDYKFTPSLSLATQPDSRNNVSLVPETRPQTPKYGMTEMMGSLKSALDQGVDFSQAAPFIQGLYSQMKAESLRNSFNGVVDGFMKDNPNATDKDAYLWAIKQKNAGYDIDPAEFTKLYVAKKLEALNLGDRVEMVDPTKPGSYKVGISPYQRESLDLTRRGQDLRYSASLANIAARIAAAGGVSGMSAADQRQFNAANAILQQHETWMQHRKDVGQMPRDEEDPNWNMVQQAQQIVNGYLTRFSGVNPQGGPAVDFNQAIGEITTALNKNATAPAGQRWNKDQFTSYIQKNYGDWILPYVDLGAWFPNNSQASGSSGTYPWWVK